MSVQPSVAEYFNSRKRPADDCKKIQNPNKVLILDSPLESTPEQKKQNSSQSEKCINVTNIVRRIVYPKKEIQGSTSKPTKLSATKTKKVSSKNKEKLPNNGYQMDVWKNLLKPKDSDKKIGQADQSNEKNTTIEVKDERQPAVGLTTSVNPPSQLNVQFHIKGPLSPAKNKKRNVENDECNEGSNTQHNATLTVDSSRKELNLGNIKSIMSRSSRLQEIKNAVKRFNENKDKLDEKITELQTPVLRKFDAIDLEVPSSPLKTPTKLGHFGSPQGKLTPRELFNTPPPPSTPPRSPLKSPAFQRYQALVTEGRPALVLPFKHRALAELFRCVDTVVSMVHNRKETVTLSKVRPGVQEMSSKNLNDYQLGQIKTIFPDAFEFSLKKVRGVGSSEKHELVITPVLSDNKEAEHEMMGPSMLLARRRIFYNALLELVKDHHEEFLSTLNPPMSISRTRLTRWHPEFPVDDVPDVFSAALPQPPNTDKVFTAKDVLEKAHNLFVVNPRMQRALQKVAENAASGDQGTPPTPTPAPAPSKPALTGVPASLLERVRAKQAARALEAMTRTPAQAQEAVRLTRLPEIARIVRNLFVAEKKSVLLKEQVLGKLGDSFRENLTHSTLDEHLKLLAEQTPGWITFCNLRKTDYVKLARNADMSRIMARLERLAADKCI